MKEPLYPNYPSRYITTEFYRSESRTHRLRDIIKKIPPELFDEIMVDISGSYDEGYEVTAYRDVPNPNYNKELKEFEVKCKEYDKQCDQWKAKIKADRAALLKKLTPEERKLLGF